MLSIGQFVYDLFQPLGVYGLLAALFLIFYFDSTLIPTLPELFTVIIFLAHPVPIFGVMMIATLCAAEFCGVTTLYLVVRKYTLPQWMRRRIVEYSRFLVVRDEKMILLNRIAPVIPFLGAFIATCEWPYGRSILYNFVGGVAKYSLIVVMASYFLLLFSDQTLAEVITVVAVLALVGFSYLLSVRRKKKLEQSSAGGSQ